jgi:hypothetical protein
MISTFSKALLLLSLAYSSSGAPAPIKEPPASMATVPKAYIIEFAQPSASEGALESSIEAAHNNFLESMERDNVNVQVRYRYGSVYNGMSVEVTNQADLNKMAASDKVKAIWPVVNTSRHTLYHLLA